MGHCSTERPCHPSYGTLVAHAQPIPGYSDGRMATPEGSGMEDFPELGTPLDQTLNSLPIYPTNRT